MKKLFLMQNKRYKDKRMDERRKKGKKERRNEERQKERKKERTTCLASIPLPLSPSPSLFLHSDYPPVLYTR